MSMPMLSEKNGLELVIDMPESCILSKEKPTFFCHDQSFVLYQSKHTLYPK
jgi:hypothetical protein